MSSIGLIIGLYNGLFFKPNEDEIEILEDVSWSWQVFRYNWWVYVTFSLFLFLTAGLLMGLLIGLVGWAIIVIGLLFGLLGDLANISIINFIVALIRMLIWGIPIGLSTSLIMWAVIFFTFGIMELGLEKRLSTRRVQPNQGIHFTLKNALSIGVFWGIAVGLLTGSVLWGLSLNNWSLVINLWFGSGGGILVGIFFYGGQSTIQHYSLRLSLHLFNTFPLKAVPFLDHCTKLILLRRVGGGYIFIHRLLLEHFAQKYREKHEGVK